MGESTESRNNTAGERMREMGNERETETEKIGKKKKQMGQQRRPLLMGR